MVGMHPTTAMAVTRLSLVSAHPLSLLRLPPRRLLLGPAASRLLRPLLLPEPLHARVTGIGSVYTEGGCHANMSTR